ncbi:DUF6538 domain-containing protein [Pseudotabrizicola alkalilacus]|nr:DUF6538 domain-containing protein [Pseudotabrizicola alkalilacus]
MNDTRQPRQYLHKEPDGYWRYIRRVPKELQTSIGKTIWRASLGKDKVLARSRAKELEREHDAMIAALRNPGTAQDSRMYLVRQRSMARMAELEAQGAPDGRDDQGDFDNGGAPYPDALPADTGTLESVRADLWRRVPAILEHSEDDTPEFRTRRLAAVSALAFGDQSRAKVPALPSIIPPVGKVAGMQHTAHKAMLDEVLEELDPTPDDTPAELRLSGVLDRYLTLKNRRGNTETSYRRKVNSFLTYMQGKDLALDKYTAADMRAYRVHLQQTLKPESVRQYFAALKTLWAWAPKDTDEYADLTFPRVDMPERATTVEDDRWQAFTDDQIKDVWKLLNAAWGPDAKSRLMPSRRAAFLMCFRVMLWTGLRPVECWHLDTDSIKGDTIHIKHTKTTGRILPLSKHLADLPGFLQAGGFAAELQSGIGRVYNDQVQTEPTSPASMQGTMRDAFREIIHAGGIKHPKLVMYSAKDTLIRKLQELDVSDDLMRGIIGHSTGQKALRNYKTPFGQSKEGLAKMRAALDAVVYW